ncbi:MAG TPA: flagellar basal body-associated FliL family protein [Stellaceae bacterium]|nr:flagellar basal body-associated FliL family protein [Stellaceae bacterium]
MSDTASPAGGANPSAASAGRRGFPGGWKIIALALAVLAAAAGGGYYEFVMRRPPPGPQAARQEPPLPFYLEVKPLVVSMSGDGSETHFVQIGVNLTLSGAAAGNLVSAMMPEVDDSLRLTALSFKVEDITTPSGVDKMRSRMVADLNRMLLRRLGAERIMQVNLGQKDLVQHIYFSQLIIE